jgi:glutathione S-transferase
MNLSALQTRPNPARKIPVLVLPSGQIVIESMAILLALDERHKQAQLLPPPATQARAGVMQWLALMAASTYPAALRFYYPDRYTVDPAEAAIEAVKAKATLDLDADFAVLADAVSGPFLLGSTITIADVYLAMLADWHAPAMAMPKISALVTAALSVPAVRAAWDNHAFGT